jgi:PIN domain nuclease of toxin-antitoxin system
MATLAALLLDTHILLWMRASPGKLTEAERTAIESATVRLISAVTFWEIAILIGLGRIEADDRLYTIPPGCDLLAVQPRHCRELASLPPIHRDPFDRMLIAQARVEGLHLVTRDEKIRGYGRAGAATID